MKLRPHHLLCVRKYTGSGYDEAFTVSVFLDSGSKGKTELKGEPFK